ncbi:hypothetical protein BaRGS_00007225, partial [Batillaria attramentaria]
MPVAFLPASRPARPGDYVFGAPAGKKSRAPTPQKERIQRRAAAPRIIRSPACRVAGQIG